MITMDDEQLLQDTYERLRILHDKILGMCALVSVQYEAEEE